MFENIASAVKNAVQSGADKEYATAWNGQPATAATVGATATAHPTGKQPGQNGQPAQMAHVTTADMPTIKPVSPQPMSMPMQSAAHADEYATAWNAPVAAQPAVAQSAVAQSPQLQGGPRASLQ